LASSVTTENLSPRFADLSRPLTLLTKHDSDFIWSPTCQKSFEALKEFLMNYPILWYPDPKKPYVLFTMMRAKLGGQEYSHKRMKPRVFRVLGSLAYIPYVT